jgi:hypothetical protein
MQMIISENARFVACILPPIGSIALAPTGPKQIPTRVATNDSARNNFSLMTNDKNPRFKLVNLTKYDYESAQEC